MENYNLSHGITAAERMNIQHTSKVRGLGFYIHPSIELPLDAVHLRIADVGTGTGIFLRDVEKLLPASAELHGFDISTENFPSQDQDNLPSSLFFHQQDLTIPFDRKFDGTFDIVNVQYVQEGLRGIDWGKGVQNLAGLLKPDGYMQWIEPDHSTCRIFTNTPGAPAAASREIIGMYSAWCKDNMLPGPLQLPGLFLNNGLGIATHEAFSSARIHSETSIHTPLMLESCGRMVLDMKVAKGEMDAKSAEYLLDRAIQETRNGDVYEHSEVCVLIGRKIEDDDY